MAKGEEQAGEKKAPTQTEGRWARWGRAGFDKSIKISDYISPYANKISSAVGGERFWPQSNDMPIEIEKCERILRAFTEEGIQQKEGQEEKVQDAKGNWIKKKVRVLRKIPPAAIRNAKGIAIYSSMRSGIAPLGGGGGSGVFMARLPDGSWSAPSAISPQNAAVGLLLGIDFLDVILLINSDKTMETFKSHRIDLGAETGIAAGPYGTGYSAEASYDRAPIYSYVRTRGAYAGVEVLGQVFLHRFDENERFYYWPGINAGDILTGKVRTIPPVVAPLHRALRDAETGRAQGGKLDRTEFDVVKVPESDVFKRLGPNYTSTKTKRSVPPSHLSTPRSEKTNSQLGSVEGGDGASQSPDKESMEELNLEEAAKSAERQLANGDGRNGESDGEEEEFVKDGERLRLPPTPAELEMMEAAGIPDEEDVRLAQEDRKKIYDLPPPPMHPDVTRHWNVHPTLAKIRPTEKLRIDGPRSPGIRQAQLTRLPDSPVFEHDMTLPFDYATSSKAEGEKSADFKMGADQMKGEDGGQVLAEGIESEEEANKIMEAAIDGGVKEVVIEKEQKDDIVLGLPETADSKATTEEETHENDTFAGVTRGSFEHDHDHSVASSHSNFDSIETEHHLQEPDTPSTPYLPPDASSDRQEHDEAEQKAKNAASNAEAETSNGDPESEDKAGQDDQVRPETPTGNVSGADTPSGVETPTTEGTRNGTPSRPPRRKRPPQKKK